LEKLVKTDQTLLGAVVLSLIACTGANAALIPALGGLVINDTDLNITWLADANYAKTSGYDSDGRMTWSQANLWIASLNASNYLGYHDWRLPTTEPLNGTAFNYSSSNNGSTDIGYNIGAQGTVYAGSTGSEMAHLFFTSFNNKSYCNPVTSTKSICDGPQAGWGLTNTGPLTNLQPGFYWSGTEYAPYNGYAWGFLFNYGAQSASPDNYGVDYALAVRSGQVAAVPLPTTAWLFSSGLLGLIGVARRQVA
jgi:hypothetical protein